MSQAPGWRPSFKYYNKWVALLGTLGCLVGMFLTDWISALVTCVIFMALYKYLDFSEPEVNWGGSSQAKVYKKTLSNLVKLEKTAEHIKTFRPQMIIFLKDRQKELNSLLFASQLSGGTGLTVAATVLLPDPSWDPSSLPRLSAIKKVATEASASPIITTTTTNERSAPRSSFRFPFGNRDYSKLDDTEIPEELAVFEEEEIFSCTPYADNFREGCRLTVQLAGIGKLRPNIVLFFVPDILAAEDR